MNKILSNLFDKKSPRSVVDDTTKNIIDTATLVVVMAFLERMGFTSVEAEALINREPNIGDLEAMLKKDSMNIPFENLGQHAHPQAGDVLPSVARCDPTLQVHRTLKKIVFDRRGGFCWEKNLAFCWLLRKLGYAARIGHSHVYTPGGPVPGHCCLYVDNLAEHTLFVDPGFGDTVRSVVPIKVGVPVTDSQLGDCYTLEKTDASQFGPEIAARYEMVLMRSRKTGFAGSPMVAILEMDAPPPSETMTPPEPLVFVNPSDDQAFECTEFEAGLASVLVDDERNFFSQKAIAMKLDEAGYTFVHKKYVKKVARGVEVSRTPLEDEAAWRAALKRELGIVL